MVLSTKILRAPLLAIAPVLACGDPSRSDGFDTAMTSAGPGPDTSGGSMATDSLTSGADETSGAGSGETGGIKYDVQGGGNPPVSCGEAEQNNAYTGCEFWPTITFNYVWQDFFSFAVAVANATDEPAEVEISRAGVVIDSATVPPEDLAILVVPWVPQLKGSQFGDQTEFTYDAVNTQVSDGAYRVVSDRPVTVYQFNAIGYENAPKPSACPDHLHPGHCYSYSNDASLLFPTSALTKNYVVTGWKNDAYSDFISITATHDGTQVEVISSASSDQNGWTPALKRGVAKTVALDAGDVVAFVANYGSGEDFSGTFIQANHPIQVLSGVPCVNIPDTGTSACDHIEESVLPVEAFGSDYVVVPPANPGGSAKHTVRILAIENGTELEFDPPSVHPPVVLDQGMTLELPGVTTGFRVWSDDASFGVSHYMHGYGQTGVGDPSQSIVVPTAQFRDEYVFLAPKDYNTNYVTVTAPIGAAVVLDGQAIDPTAFSPVGTSGLGVAHRPLSGSGAHAIAGNQAFGIGVYGYGEYTSYMYPGGLALEHITPPPFPRG